MIVVFDVVVNGEVKETIKPGNQRLQNIYAFMKTQIQLMKQKYGNGVRVDRRIVY
jgi:hypothetical protein